MSTATITSKGQVTIPKQVRDALGVRAGSRLSFVKNEEGFYELHTEQRSVKELAGSLKYDGSPKSIEEMDAAIAAAAAESML